MRISTPVARKPTCFPDLFRVAKRECGHLAEGLFRGHQASPVLEGFASHPSCNLRRRGAQRGIGSLESEGMAGAETFSKRRGRLPILEPYGYGSRLKHKKTACSSPCFNLPQFQIGHPFLTQTHKCGTRVRTLFRSFKGTRQGHQKHLLEVPLLIKTVEGRWSTFPCWFSHPLYLPRRTELCHVHSPWCRTSPMSHGVLGPLTVISRKHALK